MHEMEDQAPSHAETQDLIKTTEVKELKSTDPGFHAAQIAKKFADRIKKYEKEQMSSLVVAD